MMFLVSLVMVFQPAFALQHRAYVHGSDELNEQIRANTFAWPSQIVPEGPSEYEKMQCAQIRNYYSCLNPVIGQVHRIGEAANPGPTSGHDLLSIRTFNPTQLLGNEKVLSQWPRGLWTAAETSHTEAAVGVIKSRLRKHDINVQFGHSVGKHNNNAGIYRGRALGCANISALPLQPYPSMDNCEFLTFCRSSDALVQLGAGLTMYSGVIYGPTSTNQYYADPERVFRRATADIIERACMFRGPAVISGDFNRELDQCYFWKYLVSKGWHDVAILAMQLFGQEPEATCRERTRRSYILVNAAMAQSLKSCGIVEKFTFDSHPVLEATFDIGVQFVPRECWSLPRSADDVLIDPTLLDEHCNENCCFFPGTFQRSIAKQR